MLNLEHRNFRDALQPRYQQKPSLNLEEVWPELRRGPILMQQKFWQVLTGFVLVILAACSSSTPQTQTPMPFSLEPSSKNLTLELGGVSSFVVALKRAPDFKDIVNMTFEGLPDGISQRWSRDTENGDCTVLLSVDSETPTGEFTLKLKGEPAQVQPLSARATSGTPLGGSTQTVTINVQPTPGGSGAQGFTLAFSPAILGALQGNTVSNRAIVTPVNSFNQDVTFSVTNLPPNVSVVVDQGGPNNQFLPSKFQAFLRLTPGSNSVPGEYIVNVKAQSANFSRTEPLVLRVGAQGSSTPDFSVFTDAVSMTLRQGSSVQLLLRFMRRNGFTAPIEVEPQLSGFPGVSVTKLAGQDAALLRFAAADNANITNGLFLGLFINANADGINRSVFTLLRIDPKPGGRDATFAGGLGGGFRLSNQPVLAGFSGQNFVSGKLISDDGIIKLKRDGQPDPTFGPNGISTLNLSSTASSFTADSTVTGGAGSEFPVRMVGRLIATNVSNQNETLAMVGFSANGQQKQIKVLEFSGGIRDLGSQAPVRAIAYSDRTIVSGTVTENLPKCFLASISTGNALLFQKEFRFNPASTLDSSCHAIASIPGNNGRFFIGGVQTSLAFTFAPIVAKFGMDGELDKSFAGDGVARLTGLEPSDVVKFLMVQENGKILVGLDEDGMITRLQTDGKTDTSFGQGGVVKLNPPNFGGGTRRISKFAIGTNGAIFVLIQANSSSTVAKLNSSGALQTDFGIAGFLNISGLQDILTEAGQSPTLTVLQFGAVARFFQ